MLFLVVFDNLPHIVDVSSMGKLMSSCRERISVAVDPKIAEFMYWYEMAIILCDV